MKRLCSLFLALLLIASFSLTLASCAKGKNTLLTYERDGKTLTFSANLYRFLASRAKGSLAASGVTAGGNDATKDAFWDFTDKFDGETVETLDAYESKQILKSCKYYLAAHALFGERGLTLPDSVVMELENTLKELIELDADGSKAKFNGILSAYGVNYDLLLELYRMEEEIEALKESLYGKDASLVGKAVKDDYLNERYLHLYLVRIDPFSYVYETDENGDEVYYDTANNKVAYDKENGVKVVEDNGSVTYRLPDEAGKATGRYAYDKENGERALALASDGKSYATSPLLGDALDAFAEKIAEYGTIGTKAEFEEAYAAESAFLQDERASGYAGEAYLPTGTTYSSILDEIVEALQSMKVGEAAMLDDENGCYYLFCKDAPVSGAYDDEKLATWFSGFSAGLVNSLFEDVCEALFPYITENEEVLGKLPSMKEIEPDYYY